MDLEHEQILLLLLRNLACVLVLARFSVHTEETLSLLEDYVKKYAVSVEVSHIKLFILARLIPMNRQSELRKLS